MEQDQSNYERLDKIVSEFEATLSWKRGGSIDERVSHVLNQYRKIADNSIFETKRVMEDVKTQFKALEMIVEGLSSDGLNHGQKRTIANHIITMLRSMVDRIDRYEYKFETTSFERYNFFRSNTPEGRLREAHRELIHTSKRNEELLKRIKEKHPEIIAGADIDEIPF